MTYEIAVSRSDVTCDLTIFILLEEQKKGNYKNYSEI
jgi:hypothetical protein